MKGFSIERSGNDERPKSVPDTLLGMPPVSTRPNVCDSLKHYEQARHELRLAVIAQCLDDGMSIGSKSAVRILPAAGIPLCEGGTRASGRHGAIVIALVESGSQAASATWVRSGRSLRACSITMMLLHMRPNSSWSRRGDSEPPLSKLRPYIVEH